VSLHLSIGKHDAIQTYRVMGVWLDAFSTSALDGGEWSASRPFHFIPGE